MAATLSHFFDEGHRIRIQTGQSRFFVNYGHEEGIERRQLAGRFGNLIDIYFFLPSLIRVGVDRNVLIVTNQEGEFSFDARFSEEESEDLSNLLKEKYEEHIRSRGRNLMGVKTALMQTELNPDVLAHIASFSTGKEGTLATQSNELKQNLGVQLAPRIRGRRSTRKKSSRS